MIDVMREKDRNWRKKLLHQIFDGFAATCDFPGVKFIDDFMDSMSFPERFLSSLRTREVSAHSYFTKEVVGVNIRFRSLNPDTFYFAPYQAKDNTESFTVYPNEKVVLN